MPNLLQTAVVAEEYMDVLYTAAPSLLIQKALLTVLAPLGRALGYRADVPYSVGSQRPQTAY